jgi:4-amino-4-deoxy-L-arabinose transferase-like glycosyltransferase
VPRAALICALVACLNAGCWSILSPPFQVPDEEAHFAYVKQLAETGRLPSSGSQQLSTEEMIALEALHHWSVHERPQNRTIATRSEQESLERTLATTPHERGSPAAGFAASEPPLYYAIEAIPYRLAGGTVLDRLALMRLISAMFAGLTAMFTFLFVREAVPAASWAWTVGGLSVAALPLLGFMSGAVNPDSLLFAVSAAVFYCLARAFRRGLSTGRAAAIGAATAIGLLSKLNFVGLLPGILLGLTVLSARAARRSRRSALRMLVIGLATGLSPVIVYAGINALSNEPLFGIISAAVGGSQHALLPELDYIWQMYLPRLPGTGNYFPGLSTTRQIWFDGYVGRLGWLDTTFPSWVYNVALIPACAIALLCGRSLLRGRAMLRSRAAELSVYATMTGGLLVLVGADSYQLFPGANAEFGQTRYMLPLLPLLGAALALAARGAGRRWGPTVGALTIVLFLGQDIFSALLVTARYYG